MNGKLVIAVDAVRRGRSGPFVAAAVAYRKQTAEPLFHYTDGRGVPRDEYLFQHLDRIKPRQASALTSFLRKTCVASVPYCFNLVKAQDPKVARLVAMFWAVRKLTDRLRHLHLDELEGITPADMRLIVAGPQILTTAHFSRITQHSCPDGHDWHVRAARFCAMTAFPQIS